MVATTASLAATPASRAMSVRQSKPMGRVAGSTALPRRPATEKAKASSLSSLRTLPSSSSMGARASSPSGIAAIFSSSWAIWASKGADLSSGRPGKVMAAQIRMEMATSTVPAFLRYIQARSQQCSKRLMRVGMRYGGSSITKGVASPLTMEERSRRATSRAMTQPVIMIRNITVGALSGKNAPASSRNTGSFAPQVM